MCIGSSIAPILAEMYQYKPDVALKKIMNTCTADTVCIMRYVDNLLVCSLNESVINLCESLVRRTCSELTLTKDEQLLGRLKYLDLKISFIPGLYWSYGSKTPKTSTFGG